MNQKTFDVAYSGLRGNNPWETRIFGESKLREDMKHVSEYEIAGHSIEDSDAQFRVIVSGDVTAADFWDADGVRLVEEA